ncbi:SLATT domain-containing protein [Cupriavidus sp. CuC1]|uniref:SLATT domain-containing protein n=1 Tax=Cupriavidus sp. CuC1 TaxID=3373131 RepID=UPI0037D335E9
MPDFSSLEDQIRECFGRVVYTHKTHEKMADNCARTLWRFKVAQIAVSALTACGALSRVCGHAVAKGCDGFIRLCISGYMKGFDPGGTAQKHRDTAANLWVIRESYLSLLTDLRMQAIRSEEAIKQRDELQRKLAAIYAGGHAHECKGILASSKRAQKNEDYTFSDAEIDKFVPSSLRKTK